VKGLSDKPRYIQTLLYFTFLTKFYAAVAAGVSCQKIQKSQAHVPTYFCTKTSTSSPPESSTIIHNRLADSPTKNEIEAFLPFY